MNETLHLKWYENKILIIALLFTLPPLGIFCIFKRNTKLWKKLLYTVLAVFSSLTLLMFTMAIINPIDYFETGKTHYREGYYEIAIEDFKKVGERDKNYSDAQKYIDTVEKKLQDKDDQKKEIITGKIKEYQAFQKKWSDSIVKEWNGSYIKKNIISITSDTIYFQLSKVASKRLGNIDEINQNIYQKNFDSLATKKFGVTYKKATVKLIPDPDQQKLNNAVTERKHRINMQFAGFSGANWHVEDYIKERMNDPDSYKHIATTFVDRGSYILVHTRFRGKNALGAVIIQDATAKVDIDGNVLSLTY